MVYRGGRPEKTHLKVTYSVLAKFFGKSITTIKRWIYQGKLDPTNLEKIYDLYQELSNKP